MIYPLNINEKFVNGKNILITGGTGSFGNHMVKTLLQFKPNKIIIFSRDEFKQYMMNMGGKMTAEDLEEMMKVADPGKEGVVNIAEFADALCPPKK